MRWADTAPCPSSESPFGRCRRRSSALSSCAVGNIQMRNNRRERVVRNGPGSSSSTTHSQNSMTGEVVFRLTSLATEAFLLWNSTQFSARGKGLEMMATRCYEWGIRDSFPHIPYLCSMCCCRTTKAGPKKRSSRGRKSPRPGQWCSRSSAESQSPEYRSQDLRKGRSSKWISRHV